MDNSKIPTFSQRILARLIERRIVAYTIVGATIIGGIATFFGSIEKLLTSYTNIEKWLSEPRFSVVASQTAPSLWIRIDSFEVIDNSGMTAESAKAGYFVRTPNVPPVLQAILDPLPLKIETSDGTIPPPRHLPRRDPYALFDQVWIESDIFPLLDVDQVLVPNGRATRRRDGEKDRVVYLDQQSNEVTPDKATHHKETWGRIANLPQFKTNRGQSE